MMLFQVCLLTVSFEVHKPWSNEMQPGGQNSDIMSQCASTFNGILSSVFNLKIMKTQSRILAYSNQYPFKVNRNYFKISYVIQSSFFFFFFFGVGAVPYS